MRYGKLVISAMFMALSLFTIYFANQLPDSRGGVPGPGVWPILISAIMFVAAFIVGIAALREKENLPLELLGDNQIRVYITMVALVVYFVCMNVIGFVVSTFVMLYGFITWFSNYKLLQRIGFSLVITTVVYCIFNYVLKVPFRFGILF
ncbi:tripartite tricarboxylate transporter TctB family protein [Photobacterium rosenbergii]|uniref:Tripartite tricarboxylate transporter TctB family protein n=1 Tax=Photobacterium rosenbergii TaxID=294936 RepID=A0ABU3ZB80_9GAMM|nr:tripartite tricarboxylate transporter TctB family protein [Photobacterium rosenbergii]MDV5167377.1 tripartite tricarboxylate transporter TctB family protein [Photobacterium rosenbergii]